MVTQTNISCLTDDRYIATGTLSCLTDDRYIATGTQCTKKHDKKATIMRQLDQRGQRNDEVDNLPVRGKRQRSSCRQLGYEGATYGGAKLNQATLKSRIRLTHEESSQSREGGDVGIRGRDGEIGTLEESSSPLSLTPTSPPSIHIEENLKLSNVSRRKHGALEESVALDQRIGRTIGMVGGRGYRKRPYEKIEQWMDNEISFPSVPRPNKAEQRGGYGVHVKVKRVEKKKERCQSVRTIEKEGQM
ncbi:hypothetical protein Tco_1479457 [Tanacetum coccineum]